MPKCGELIYTANQKIIIRFDERMSTAMIEKCLQAVEVRSPVAQLDLTLPSTERGEEENAAVSEWHCPCRFLNENGFGSGTEAVILEFGEGI